MKHCCCCDDKPTLQDLYALARYVMDTHKELKEISIEVTRFKDEDDYEGGEE